MFSIQYLIIKEYVEDEDKVIPAFLSRYLHSWLFNSKANTSLSAVLRDGSDSFEMSLCQFCLEILAFLYKSESFLYPLSSIKWNK